MTTTIDGPTSQPVQIQALESIVVTENGSIDLASGRCIYTDGTIRADITINGRVKTASPSVALYLWKGIVTIGAQGRIETGGVALNFLDYGGQTNNTDRVVSNSGTIEGKIGISGLTLNITNSGEINASEIGVNASGFTNVTNTGTIRGQTAIKSTGNNSKVINSGHLEGVVHAVLFGDGNDLYDARGGGTSTGLIELGGGNDTAYGGAGSEVFNGGAGNDTIDGGGGIDTVVFAGSNAIIVDLNITGDQNTGAGLDKLLNIENVTSDAGNDVLIGNELANRLTSGDGNDTLEGGAGDDVLDGGTQAVDGFDTARYLGMADAIVSLIESGAQDTRGYGFDTLIGIEALEGGDGNDRFTGDDQANRLWGNGGNDTLVGGKGDDTLDGGSGNNTAVFAGSRTEYDVSNPDANGIGTVHDTQAGRDGTDTLKNIRFIKFAGDNQTVTLYNTKPDSVAFSKTAFAENLLVNMPLATLSAHDAEGDAITYTLSDPSGTFRLDGDVLVLLKPLDYETKTSYSVTVTAKDQYGLETTQEIILTVTDIGDTPGDPSHPTDPGSPSDVPLTLTGTAGADTLAGRSNNDVIVGLSGKDRLYGDNGNDKLSGGLSNDTLVGGAGQDIFVFDTKLAKTNMLNKKQNLDKIIDFVVADDTIHLAKSVFSKIAKKGVLKKGEFYVGTKAHDRDDHVIYNKKTGALFYDADGTSAKEAIQFATLQKNLKLTHLDVFVV